MKTISLPWIGGALLGLGALSILYHFSSQTRTQETASVATGNITALATDSNAQSSQATRDELAALQAQIDRLRAQQTAQRLTADNPPVDAKRGIEEDHRRHLAYVAGVQAAFRQERVDPAWSPIASSRIRDAISHNEAMRGAMRNVECRSSTCRVEISNDAGGAANKNLPMLLQQFSDLLPRTVAQSVVNASGQTEMVLYLMAPDPASAGGPKG